MINHTRIKFPLEQVISCPACDSTEHNSAFAPDVSKCDDCDLYFRNPRPTQESILKSYEYGLTFHRWQQELEVRRFLWQKRLELIRKYKKSGTLIDVGTGDGYFLKFTQPYFDSVATELSATGVKYAQNHGHRIFHGKFNELVKSGQKFDVITLWHVLEHVPDPANLLSQLRNHLEPDGILAIAIPNESLPILCSQLSLPKSLGNWLDIDPQHPLGRLTFGEEIHLTHFTPRVIKSLLKRRGLHVLEFGVDDVHLQRDKRTILAYQFNRLLNFFFGTHFDKAMYFVCTLK